MGIHILADHKGRGQKLQGRCHLAISYLATTFGHIREVYLTIG